MKSGSSPILKRPVLLALLLAVVVRIGWLAVSQIGVEWQRPGDSRYTARDADGVGYVHTPVQAIDVWTRWDGAHYLAIVRDGYAYSIHVAFFPAYPLLVRAVRNVGIPPHVAALLVSNVADIVAWLLLALLAVDRLGRERAAAVVIAFAVFPTRNFGFSAYTEGIFLLLSVGAFLAYERRRFGVAGLCGAVLSAVRPQGLLVGFALFVDGVVKRWRKQANAPSVAGLAALALAPAGLVAYMSFLAAERGDPLAFMEAQKVWRRSLSWPWTTLFELDTDPHVYLIAAAAVGLTVLAIIKKEPLRDIIYCSSALAIPLTSGTMMSFGRFAGVLFPLFLLGAAETRPRSWVRWGYVALAIVLSVVMAFKVGQSAKVI